TDAAPAACNPGAVAPGPLARRLATPGDRAHVLPRSRERASLGVACDIQRRPESTPLEPDLVRTSVGKRPRQASSPVAFTPSPRGCGVLVFPRTPQARTGRLMFSRSPLDWGLIAVYFGFLAVVWLRRSAHRTSAVDYLLAGRRVTLPAFVATLVATW